jgi:hypothetical protein
MKALVYSLANLVLLTFFFAPGLVRAQDNPGEQDVSFQAFYDQLGDQGTWIQTDNYGYVFQPNVSDPNWAPYTDGHWVSTDQGWTWVSNEPWGWATYHYGRWANIDGTGWVWVPGYRWAPAWVSWRYGGGYCGWAPLPPETLEGADDGDQGYHFGNDVDVSFSIGAGCYNFLPVGDMGESNYRGRYVARGNNYGIINNTTNVTNININNHSGPGNAAANFGGVTTGGPSLKTVNAHSRQHVSTVQLTRASQPGTSVLQGKSLAVFAPHVAPAAGQQAKPAQVAQTISHPSFNRGTTITKPLDVTANVKAPAPTPQAIEKARLAETKVPVTAKIARENTTMNTPLGKPPATTKPVVAETPHNTPEFPDAKPASSSEVKPDADKPKVSQHAAYTPSTDEQRKPAPTPQPYENHPQSTEPVHQPAQPQQEARPEKQEQPQERQAQQSQQQAAPQKQPQPQVHQQQQQAEQHAPVAQKTEQAAPQKKPADNNAPGAPNFPGH